MRRSALTNPLGRGFYTAAEAARLIRVGSTRRINAWLRGYPGRQIGPLLTRDYHPLGKHEELSFLDLMEVRFVEHFREHGAKVRTLRIAAEQLRKDFKTEHPFALRDVLLVADRADVYVREVLRKSAEEAGDMRLRSLVTNNYVMYEAIKAALLPGVTFNPATHLASTWQPMPEEFPRVTVNPKVAYGQPALPSGIPTGTLFDAWKAENENVDTVAYWFGIGSADVLEAVRFEQALDRTAERLAA